MVRKTDLVKFGSVVFGAITVAGCLGGGEFKSKHSDVPGFSSNAAESEREHSVDSSSGDQTEGLQLSLYEEGARQYKVHCMSCHSELESSTKRFRTSSQIREAVSFVSKMSPLKSVSDLNYEALEYALNNQAPTDNVVGGPSDGGSSDPADPVMGGGDNDGGSPDPVEASTQKYSCQDDSLRGMATDTARRLTQIELKLTLKDLFGPALIQKVESSLGLYPKERFTESVSEFTPDIDSNRLEGLINILERVAEVVSTDSQIRAQALPSCMINQLGNIDLSNDTCNSSFIDSMGLKVLRRPVEEAEKQALLEMLTDQQSFYEYNRDRIEVVLLTLLLDARFIHHLNFIQAGGVNRSRIDQYSLASRMSYLAAGTMPDAQLFAAASQAKLEDKAERQSHANRLIRTQSGREYVKSVFYHVLELDRMASPSSEYGEYLSIDSNNLAAHLRQEALTFVEHIVFEKEGNYEALLTSPAVFPPTSHSAKLFQSEVSTGANDPQAGSGQYTGLYSRPAVLLSSSVRTSPIERGIKLNRGLLCRTIPEPDPEQVEAGEDIIHSLNELEVSSRELAEQATKGAECQVCHQHINPPGFFFEGFGPFGEPRQQESIFTSEGDLHKKLPIDTQVSGFRIDNQPQTIGGAQEFMQKVAQSTDGQSCFATNVFQYSHFRYQTQEDTCKLSDIEKSIRSNQSILNAFIQNAISEDQLWLKTN